MGQVNIIKVANGYIVQGQSPVGAITFIFANIEEALDRARDIFAAEIDPEVEA